MSADVETVPKTITAKSVLSQLYDFSGTPYLSILNSSLILVSPVISPAIKVSKGAIATSVKGKVSKLLSSQTKYLGFTTKNALLFGVTQLLGSWMIYDDDLEDGSGFLMAWSTLFLMVNGKNSLRCVKYGKMWPLLLSSMALTNVGLYGKRFITGSFE